MVTKPPTQMSSRERIALVLFIISIVFVVFSIITNLVLEASEPMMVVGFAAFLFAVLPLIAIIQIKRRPPYPKFFYRNPNTAKIVINRYANGVRAMGLIFGLLMLLFTVGSALTAYEIYEPDIPGGIILAFSGFIAIAGSVCYKLELDPHMEFSDLPPPPPMYEKEIIREKEVIVKIRCQYCGNTFNETLDQCSTCGAKK